MAYYFTPGQLVLAKEQVISMINGYRVKWNSFIIQLWMMLSLNMRYEELRWMEAQDQFNYTS